MTEPQLKCVRRLGCCNDRYNLLTVGSTAEQLIETDEKPPEKTRGRALKPFLEGALSDIPDQGSCLCQTCPTDPDRSRRSASGKATLEAQAT